MKLVTRAQWGARPPKRTAPALWTDLATIHWEGPSMGTFDHERCAGKVRTIQAFHMDTRGWNDIAYSAIVCPHGYVFEGRGRGARTGANGTNTGNAAAYAVCALVGLDDPQPETLLDGITDAVAWLDCTRTNAHRDWKPTACPGDALAAHAHSGRFLTAPDPTPTPQPPKDEPLMVTDDDAKKIRQIVDEALEAALGPASKLDTPSKVRSLFRHLIEGPDPAKGSEDLTWPQRVIASLRRIEAES